MEGVWLGRKENVRRKIEGEQYKIGRYIKIMPHPLTSVYTIQRQGVNVNYFY